MKTEFNSRVDLERDGLRQAIPAMFDKKRHHERNQVTGHVMVYWKIKLVQILL